LFLLRVGEVKLLGEYGYVLALPLDFARARPPLAAVGLAGFVILWLLRLAGYRQKQYRRKCCKQNAMKESWH
jgi:hypothetical protein